MLANAELPDRCEFEHKVFTTLGAVQFRRSATDGVPMMTLQLGEREAMLPIESLRREFDIGKDTADGRMLDLIGSALDFVPSLQPGDRLPPEVRTGEASWKPGPDHVNLAATRLKLALVAWMSPSSRWAKAGQDQLTLLRLATDPALQEELRLVADAVCGQLALPNGQLVIRRLTELSLEMAHIEALRERLQERVSALCRRLGRLMRDRKRPTVPFDTLTQVHRLASVAAKQIVDRFDDVDAQTGEIGSLLRNIENQRSFIRANRDWLYRAQLAWEPVLNQWGQHDDVAAATTGGLLATTYRFLAQRSLPGTAWERPRQTRRNNPAPASMAW